MIKVATLGPGEQRGENTPPTAEYVFGRNCSRLLSMGIVVAILGLSQVQSSAQLTINVGSVLLPAETSVTLPFIIEVNNDGTAPLIGGLEFAVEIAPSGPRIQTVDLLNGTIFQDNNDNGQQLLFGSPDLNHIQFWTVVRDTSISPAPSLSSTSPNRLASITFNTTGVAPGDYAIKVGDVGSTLEQTSYLDTASGAIGMTIINGTLTVVPEPNATFAVAGLLLGLAGFARRWRAKQ